MRMRSPFTTGFAAGQNVVLYEQDGVVKYAAPAEPTAADLAPLRAELETARVELQATADLREAMGAVREEVTGFRAAALTREAETETLRRTLGDLETRHAALLTRAESREQEVVALRSGLEALRGRVETTAPAGTAAPAAEELRALRETVAALQQTHAERGEDVAQLKTQFTTLSKRVGRGG